MTWLFSSFKSSAKELRNLKTLTVVGMLIALSLIIGTFSVSITPTLKLSFSFLATAAIGMIGGPVVGLFAGAMIDILDYMLKPDGGFNPIFTAIDAFGGMLWGICLYQLHVPAAFAREEGRLAQRFFSKDSAFMLLRIVGAKLSITVIINLILNTAALYFMYSTPFWALFIPRLVKNALLFPLEAIMLVLVLVPVKQIYDATQRTRA